MNIVKQILQLPTKQKLQLSKEGVEYIASIIPPAVSHISSNTPPEVAAVFATALKATLFKIIDKASEFMDAGADIREVDMDWRANYFDKCRLVHDDYMQSLWAKILAGEANEPGTYSKRTVNFVADLDKRDAELFTALCRYICEIKYKTENTEKKEYVPLIYDAYLPFNYNKTIPQKYHIRIEDFNHLDNIGIIRFAEADDYFCSDGTHVDGAMEVSYYSESIYLYNSFDFRNGLPIGRIKLTRIGKELYPICGSTPVDGFFSHICSYIWLPFIKYLDEAKAKEIKSTYKDAWGKNSIE